jgi:ribulose-bisphosphate carboxylase small chain
MKTLPKERRYETFFYLPPLTYQQITKQIENMLDQGFIAGVEFE